MKTPEFGEVAEKMRRATVQIVSGSGRSHGVGSGVIWNADGAVITNAHVARDKSLQVELWNGRSFPARVAERDDRADLALLHLPAGDLPSLEWRPSHSLRPGELVIAVGNPLGFTGALTTGVVHTSGPVRGLGRNHWVQASIRLAPGNSGGPLADAEGRVVGINTMIVMGGLALAIPSDRVVDFLKWGRGPALGVTLRPVEYTGGGIGLLVLDIEPNSAAEYVSLAAGDVLVGANGRSFESADDLSEAIDQSAGSILRLRFLRGGRANQREVSVAFPGPRREAA